MKDKFLLSIAPEYLSMIQLWLLKDPKLNVSQRRVPKHCEQFRTW